MSHRLKAGAKSLDKKSQKSRSLFYGRNVNGKGGGIQLLEVARPLQMRGPDSGNTGRTTPRQVSRTIGKTGWRKVHNAKQKLR
jgi:hypothetical protein